MKTAQPSRCLTNPEVQGWGSPHIYQAQPLSIRNGEAKNQRGQNACLRPHSKPATLIPPPSPCSPPPLPAPPTPSTHPAVPGPSLPHTSVSPPDPPGGVLFQGEGAWQLNDIEFSLKDTIAESDLGRKKQRCLGDIPLGPPRGSIWCWHGGRCILVIYWSVLRGNSCMAGKCSATEAHEGHRKPHCHWLRLPPGRKVADIL